MGTNVRQGIVTNGLVLHLDAANRKSYPGTGTVWNDLSGLNNSGSLVNGPRFSNINGGTIVFDGNNDYVGVNSVISSRNVSGGTVEVVFNMNAGSTNLCLFGFGDSTNFDTNRGGLQIGNNASAVTNEIFSYGNFFAGNTFFMAAINPSSPTTNEFILRDGRYHSITIVVANGDYRAYLDGIQQTLSFPFLGSSTNNQFINVPNVNTFRLGWEPFGGGRFYMDGNIPTFKLYNRALSASEVAQNYNATKTRFGLS